MVKHERPARGARKPPRRPASGSSRVTAAAATTETSTPATRLVRDRPRCIEKYRHSTFAYVLRSVEPVGVLFTAFALLVACVSLLREGSAQRDFRTSQEDFQETQQDMQQFLARMEISDALREDEAGLVLESSEVLAPPDAQIREQFSSGRSSRIRETLEGAIFLGIDVRNLNLEGADLIGADLSDSDLTGANLTGANLADANLTGTNLSGTDLTSATGLTQAQLDTACGDRPPRNLPDDAIWRFAACCPGGAETWRGLHVCEEQPREGYDRAAFGTGYTSLAHDIIAALPATIKVGDQVYTPYSCTRFDVTAAGTAATDIDHIVALVEAHDSRIAAHRRRNLASDLDNLTIAAPAVNRAKAGRDVAEWTPARHRAWFAAQVIQVKLKYGLSVDPAERDALEMLLAGGGAELSCP